VLLTLAGLLVAVGFGGSRAVIVGRAVAVVVPGVAITVLIAPYLENSRWPYGPVAAVGVATMCHLALALTRELPDNEAASALWAGRQLVMSSPSPAALPALPWSGHAGRNVERWPPRRRWIIAAIWGRIPVSASPAGFRLGREMALAW
jgi:hypothetical protein